MENKTIDVSTLSDLELMSVSLQLNKEIQALQSEYGIVMNEYNKRAVSAAEKAKNDSKENITDAEIIK